MAKQLSPVAPQHPITAPMIAAARRALGAVNTAADKIAVFKNAGLEYPDLEAINNDLRKKAEGLLAAADLLYNGIRRDGTES